MVVMTVRYEKHNWSVGVVFESFHDLVGRIAVIIEDHDDIGVLDHEAAMVEIGDLIHNKVLFMR